MSNKNNDGVSLSFLSFSKYMQNESEESAGYGDDSDDDNDSKDNEQPIDPPDIIDLRPLIRALPATLEAFSFSSKKEDILEDKYKFEEFILALVHLGVKDLSFSKIHFKDDKEHPNVKLFKRIFTEESNLKNIRFLKFHRCPNVFALDGIIDKTPIIESLSLTDCNISGTFA